MTSKRTHQQTLNSFSPVPQPAADHDPGFVTERTEASQRTQLGRLSTFLPPRARQLRLSMGNRALDAATPAIQTKLTVNRPDARAKEDDERIQAKERSSRNAAESRRRDDDRTGLPKHLKAGVENLSNVAMDDVRVNYNSPRPAGLQATAFTRGTEIHLATGEESLLPHEAWHVVQQKQGRVRPNMHLRGVGINDDPALEREADVMGAKANDRRGPSALSAPALAAQRSTPLRHQRLMPVQRTVSVRPGPRIPHVALDFTHVMLWLGSANIGRLLDDDLDSIQELIRESTDHPFESDGQNRFMALVASRRPLMRLPDPQFPRLQFPRSQLPRSQLPRSLVNPQASSPEPEAPTIDSRSIRSFGEGVLEGPSSALGARQSGLSSLFSPVTPNDVINQGIVNTVLSSIGTMVTTAGLGNILSLLARGRAALPDFERGELDFFAGNVIGSVGTGFSLNTLLSRTAMRLSVSFSARMALLVSSGIITGLGFRGANNAMLEAAERVRQDPRVESALDRLEEDRSSGFPILRRSTPALEDIRRRLPETAFDRIRESPLTPIIGAPAMVLAARFGGRRFVETIARMRPALIVSVPVSIALFAIPNNALGRFRSGPSQSSSDQ